MATLGKAVATPWQMLILYRRSGGVIETSASWVNCRGEAKSRDNRHRIWVMDFLCSNLLISTVKALNKVLDTTIADPSHFGPKSDGDLGPAFDGGDGGDQDGMINFDEKRKK